MRVEFLKAYKLQCKGQNSWQLFGQLLYYIIKTIPIVFNTRLPFFHIQKVREYIIKKWVVSNVNYSHSVEEPEVVIIKSAECFETSKSDDKSALIAVNTIKIRVTRTEMAERITISKWAKLLLTSCAYSVEDSAKTVKGKE